MTNEPSETKTGTAAQPAEPARGRGCGAGGAVGAVVKRLCRSRMVALSSSGPGDARYRRPISPIPVLRSPEPARSSLVSGVS